MESGKPGKTKATQISCSTRMTILDIVHSSNASHIGSSFSVVEILRAVYRNVDIGKIKDQSHDRDRVIVSKGHSAAALYAVLFEFGLMSKTDLGTYHMNNSLLGGHASHFVPYVEHSTGALGHGLPVAVGMCLGLRSKGFLSSRVYVIVGDGEMQEGSNWEALMLAGHHEFSNLCVLVDDNGLGGIGETDENCSLNPLRQKFDSFGFATFEVNGHDEEEICSVIHETCNSVKPVAIICDTVKGKGASFMENNNIWHYRPPGDEEYAKIRAEILRRDKGL